MCWTVSTRPPRFHAADVIVRVTADCPLIDPDVIDRVVHALFDTAARILPPTDCRRPGIAPTRSDWTLRCAAFAALERAWHEANRTA